MTTLIPDHQGTTHHQVSNAAGSLRTTWQDPYGRTRGAAPSEWVGDRSFVGGTKDATGLVRIGARDYDPRLQRFVTVDPIQDLTDPLQWNPYLYANNTPITKSDPSGLKPLADGDYEYRSVWDTRAKRVAWRLHESARKPPQAAPKHRWPQKPRVAPKPPRLTPPTGDHVPASRWHTPSGADWVSSAADAVNSSLTYWADSTTRLLSGMKRLDPRDRAAYEAELKPKLRVGGRAFGIVGGGLTFVMEAAYRAEWFSAKGFDSVSTTLLSAAEAGLVVTASAYGGVAGLGLGAAAGGPVGAVAGGVTGGLVAGAFVGDAISQFNDFVASRR